MELHATVVDIAPDPLAIARRLRDRRGLSCLLGGPGEASFVAVDPVSESDALDPEPSLPLARAERDLARAPRWVGLLPYEARRELERPRDPDPRAAPHLLVPRWLRFRETVEVSDRVRVIGDERGRVAELARALSARPIERPPARLAPLGPDEPELAHVARVRRALEHIAKGDVYVINVARRFRFATGDDPLALLEHLGRRARSRYGIALGWDGLGVAGQSPELFLRTHADGSVETCPIKGTRPRGTDAESDRALALELARDPKEAAELHMVVDVERNDLGRVARPSSVRVTERGQVVMLPSVFHRVARVTARLRPDVGREALLRATLPSGSVTGAPKVRAMELVRELEAERRGLYTGAYGLLRHDGTLELAMAIRTLTVVGDEAHYFAGGGIVEGSDPERETLETRWKALGLV